MAASYRLSRFLRLEAQLALAAVVCAVAVARAVVLHCHGVVVYPRAPVWVEGRAAI